ncbi:MAG: protein-methionine-sulfoxide reductase catalytic subunit MsrP [bacterium]
MIIKTPKPKKLRIEPSEIASESIYLRRRQFVQAMGLSGIAFASQPASAILRGKEGKDLPNIKESDFNTDEDPTSWEDVTSYNNYYEFGLGKGDPIEQAVSLKPKPWSIHVSGEAEMTGNISLEDLIKPYQLEERIYRMRCVEAWSMVIPWVGFPLADVIKTLKPNSHAKYIAFETLNDRKQMPGVRRRVLDWPYREGLRMDEAMNPLTLLAVGLYGKELPNQNGAPLRLVVPWKYGFKGIKSIVSIRFTRTQPRNSWNMSAPREYGFYANVNPEVDHPRWSQASERRIGAGFGLFNPRRDTLPFNGYADEVAAMYKGMNLRKNF